MEHQLNISGFQLTATPINWAIAYPVGDNLYLEMPNQWLVEEGDKTIAVITRWHGKYSLLSAELKLAMPCQSIDYALEACACALLRRTWR